MSISFGTNDAALALQHLEGTLARRYRAPVGALLSVAMLDESPGFLTGALRFSDTHLEPRTPRNYDSLALLESWLPHEQVFGWLTQVLAGQSELCGRPLATRFGGANSDRHVAGRLSRFNWTTDQLRFSLRERGGVQAPYRTVVQFNYPPFPTIPSAVRHWIQGDQLHDSGDIPDEGCLVVDVPDTRGRIVAAQLSRQRVAVQLELHAAREHMQLQLSAAERLPFFSTAAAVAQDHVDIEVPADIEQLYVYLVHHPGDLLSHVELSRITPVFGTRSAADTELQRAHLELRNGENEQVEYKPFIEPRSEKERELVETVIAFANSSGGRIYIGADKHGNPTGIAALRKRFRRDLPDGGPDALVERLEQHLRQLVCDSVRPVPPHTAMTLSVAGSPILVLDVAEGHSKPYATHENDVFVRKGATNRKPDPHTEYPRIAPTMWHLGPTRPPFL